MHYLIAMRPANSCDLKKNKKNGVKKKLHLSFISFSQIKICTTTVIIILAIILHPCVCLLFIQVMDLNSSHQVE